MDQHELAAALSAQRDRVLDKLAAHRRVIADYEARLAANRASVEDHRYDLGMLDQEIRSLS